jgi:hypothetical protein
MIETLLTLAAVLIAVLLAVGKVPLGYTLRSLTVRWRTTLLTALAFTAMVTLLIAMLAFVNGMKIMTEGTGVPGNVMILADGATDEAFSNLSVADLTEIESEPAIVTWQGRPMVSRETYLVVNQMIPNSSPGRPQRRFLQLRGLDDPLMAARVHEISLQSGTWFSDAGVRELKEDAYGEVKGATLIEAVLGEGVARELGRDRTPEQLARARNRQRLDVGDTFKLGNRLWLVVGVMRSSGSTFNSEIWAKRALIAAIFGKDTYTTLVVRTADEQSAAAFCQFLKEKYTKAPVSPQVEKNYYASLQETNKQFLVAIIFITIVMSVGGVFGIMNTMFAAVNQRIKDIGVLRLIGYAPEHVLVAILLESLLIAMLGGIFGCALGSLCHGMSATSVVAGVGMGKSVALQLTVDSTIYAVAILLTLVLGILGGLLPGLSAMRLKPLEALR